MPNELEQTLSTIAKMAPELRRAGVRGQVTAGDVSFEIAPDDPQPATDKPKAEETAVDPMNDPKTYGFTNFVPGFVDPRPKEKK
jgi:hypothetical protein